MDSDLSKAVLGNALRRLVDLWAEVQQILKIGRQAAANFVERVMLEENIELYLDNQYYEGLWFPSTNAEIRAKLLNSITTSPYAAGDQSEHDAWNEWRILPADFSRIARVADAIALRSDSVANYSGHIKWADSAPAQESIRPESGSLANLVREYNSVDCAVLAAQKKAAILGLDRVANEIGESKEAVAEFLFGSQDSTDPASFRGMVEAIYSCGYVVIPSDHVALTGTEAKNLAYGVLASLAATRDELCDLFGGELIAEVEAGGVDSKDGISLVKKLEELEREKACITSELDARGIALALQQDDKQPKEGARHQSDLADARREIERLAELVPARPDRLMAIAMKVQSRYWGDNWDQDDRDTWPSKSDILGWIEQTYPTLSGAQREAIEVVACPVDRTPSAKKQP